jgi:PBSX family phage terminase large subunit
MTVADIEETYRPYGGNSQLFTSKQPELILSGPAGTGKSRANLEYLNYWAMNYPGARLLMVRKTRRSLGESGMVTFEQKVLHPAQGVRFHNSKQQYQYPNGSILAVGGLDKPSKIMSTDWDIIYAQEATELEEDDWETCTIRLRWGGIPMQQMIGDCNPAQSTHWMLQRARDNKTLMYETRHEDNPMLFNRDNTMTPEGERYLSKLDNLTGVRYARYRLGLWVSAEGMVFEDSWDRKRNLINAYHIPAEWPRYLAIDFGFTNPFVCLWAAIDPDGRIIIYRQLYKTKTLVEDHAKEIKRVSRWGEKGGEPLPRAIICDTDAEDRATLERHMSLYTIPAHKTVSDGIQAVASRFRAAGDGKARIQIMRDCLVERDRDLAEGKQPTCLEDEPESYVWDTRQGLKRGDQPVKEHDHALDALRYLTAYFDLKSPQVKYSQRVY